MNTGNKSTWAVCGMAVITLLSGCEIPPYYGGGVAVGVPPPSVEITVTPDYYYWDGFEYVGIVGSQYYYLGPGNVWIVCEPFRVERFRAWERGHPDWREHATRNERFRPDDRGRGHGHGHDRGDEH
jgi:hypothetical protein